MRFKKIEEDSLLLLCCKMEMGMEISSLCCGLAGDFFDGRGGSIYARLADF
jgi:hypothetical protein